ncbi:ORF6N domain-containing protein [Pseudoflavitalea rhizosphaerae]|uniref:ORF6N domain-containing protein n=1 Tax=Pseudoflavitalea rhizosphaerae TaxID=1884793 RepID=UPI001F4943F1|nr:ORF6N domain-containing protein [Pseudoflavitalea rhizosphaerae]
MMVEIERIQHRIYTIRGERVMLDFDLAALYQVETKVLNQAVKRNQLRRLQPIAPQKIFPLPSPSMVLQCLAVFFILKRPLR